MQRFDWLRRIEGLDPAVDHHEIYRIMVAHEFPWDMHQALSFALFRTYAVPSIGSLLARTGELVDRTQKRYDDTVLILDAVLEHGFDSAAARAAFRAMNRMHGSYAIANADMLYVLSTFVVVPIRWIDAYGWRPLSRAEKVASVHYYRAVGARMNIAEMPDSVQGFVDHLDAYESEHFAFDDDDGGGGRAVAEATLDLLATFPPYHLLPEAIVRRVSLALMDDPLRVALRLPDPGRRFGALVRAGLAARGRVVRFLPPRVEPRYGRHLSHIRSYPHGHDVAELGTFPRTGDRGRGAGTSADDQDRGADPG